MSKLLVVFIHGLSDTEKTWDNLITLLNKDDKLSRKITTETYSYKTKKTRFLFLESYSWKSLRLQDLATGLDTKIKHLYSDVDKILLVGHSMGGLIAKYYLTEKIKSSEHEKILGIIFYATPHTGSGFANLVNAISSGHLQTKQLKKNSDFVDLLESDFRKLKVIEKVKVTYVVAGQDVVVGRESAGINNTPFAELIPDKDHSSIIQPDPDDRDDLSYLILRNFINEILEELYERNHLIDLSEAIETNDQSKIEALIINKGRSWIESEYREEAIELLGIIVGKYETKSILVIWSKYLIAISKLFRDRVFSPELCHETILKNAADIGIQNLLKAECMEFERHKKERDKALDMAKELISDLETAKIARTPHESYAQATSYFLLSNLFRAGGQLYEAVLFIDKAISLYSPAILSHQIEIAHCLYAKNVCRVMLGNIHEDSSAFPTLAAPEFRLFSEALLLLTRSHIEWTSGRVGQSADFATKASEIFSSIGYRHYAERAIKLKSLLNCWQILEYNGSIDSAAEKASSLSSVIRGLVTHNRFDEIRYFIANEKPSRVLGMLQFAVTYNPNSINTISDLELPHMLHKENSEWKWGQIKVESLTEAESKLRVLMGIKPEVRIPLIID